MSSTNHQFRDEYFFNVTEIFLDAFLLNYDVK